MRRIRFIVVHTSATADKRGNPVDASLESMRRYHVEHNGWPDIGYHYVIRFDGSVEEGLPLETVGMHVGGFNLESVGICVSGHGDLAPFTDAQAHALTQLCATLVERFKLDARSVIGHNETDDYGGPPVAKTCPGTKVDMAYIRAAVAVEYAVRHPAPQTKRGVGLSLTEPVPLVMPATSTEGRLAALERRCADIERRLSLA